MTNTKNSSLSRTSSLMAAAVAVALLAACGGGGGTSGGESPTAPGAASAAELEYQSFSLANGARDQANVRPELDLEALLSEVARDHSRAMRDQNFFGHVAPGGQDLRARLQAAGIQYRSAGENLAKMTGSGDPAGAAHAQLMSSPRHRDNILSPKFEAAGVGVARQGDTVWFTQIYVNL